MNIIDQIKALTVDHAFPRFIGYVGSAATELAHPSHVRRERADSLCELCREFGPVKTISAC